MWKWKWEGKSDGGKRERGNMGSFVNNSGCILYFLRNSLAWGDLTSLELFSAEFRGIHSGLHYTN